MTLRGIIFIVPLTLFCATDSNRLMQYSSKCFAGLFLSFSFDRGFYRISTTAIMRFIYVYNLLGWIWNFKYLANPFISVKLVSWLFGSVFSLIFKPHRLLKKEIIYKGNSSRAPYEYKTVCPSLQHCWYRECHLCMESKCCHKANVIASDISKYQRMLN